MTMSQILVVVLLAAAVVAWVLWPDAPVSAAGQRDIEDDTFSW